MLKEMVIIMRKRKVMGITKMMKMIMMIKKEAKTRALRGKTGTSTRSRE